MKTIEVEILGNKYHFKTDNPEELTRFASHMNEKLEKLKKNFNTVDKTKLFVLYSLMLTEKYFIEKESSSNLRKETQKIDHLLDGIDID